MTAPSSFEIPATLVRGILDNHLKIKIKVAEKQNVEFEWKKKEKKMNFFKLLENNVFSSFNC